MTGRSVRDFIRAHWEVVAKFAYEQYLNAGAGAVVIDLNQDNCLDNLQYLPVAEIPARLNPMGNEARRLYLERLTPYDPERTILYCFGDGHKAMLSQSGHMHNGPANVYYAGQFSETDYFPSSILLSDYSSVDELKRKWYSCTLQAMKEPVLFRLQNESKETYRFLWLRSFHRPVAIRIEKNGINHYSLVVKELDDIGGGCLFKKISASTQVVLESYKWEEFNQLIMRARFWQLAPYRTQLGLDGADWVLEGACVSKYHVVTRWSPESNGTDRDFRAACAYLLDLSGIEVPLSEVY